MVPLKVKVLLSQPVPPPVMPRCFRPSTVSCFRDALRRFPISVWALHADTFNSSVSLDKHGMSSYCSHSVLRWCGAVLAPSVNVHRTYNFLVTINVQKHGMVLDRIPAVGRHLYVESAVARRVLSTPLCYQ